MKTCIIYLLFFILSGMILAKHVEHDSVSAIEREILEYEETDLLILSKSRKIIIDNIKTNNLVKVNEIYFYLENKFDKKNMVTFWSVEDWFILLWLELYDELIDKILKYSPEQNYYNDKVVPPRDMFFEHLQKISSPKKQILLTSIRKSKLERYQKEFLYLLLEYLLVDPKYSEIAQQRLNDQSDQYLSEFKTSEFSSFIRNYIRYVYVTSDWGFGLDFYSGQGKFDSNMSKYFRDNITLGHGFEVSYKNVICYLRNYIGIGEVNTGFEYKGNWKKGLDVNVFHPEISFGYVTLDNATFKIVPFCGYSAMHITPTDHAKKKPENDVNMEWVSAFTYGLNIDYKISESSAGIIGENENGSWFIRLRIGYSNPNYEDVISGLSGNMLYINLGMGGFARKILRDW